MFKQLSMALLATFVVSAPNFKQADNATSCHWYGFPCASESDCCVDGSTPSCCMDGFCQGGSVCNAVLDTVVVNAPEPVSEAQDENSCLWIGTPCDTANCCPDPYGIPTCCKDDYCKSGSECNALFTQ